MNPNTGDGSIGPEEQHSPFSLAGDFVVIKAHTSATIESSQPWEMVMEDAANGERYTVTIPPVYTTWQEVVEAGAQQARAIRNILNAR